MIPSRIPKPPGRTGGLAEPRPRQRPQLPGSRGAGRAAVLAPALAISVVAILALHGFTPPVGSSIADPVNRLVVLAVVLAAGGVYAVHRSQYLPVDTTIRLGMAFEILVAFAVSMIETSRAMRIEAALPGFSAVGLLMMFLGAAIPTAATVRLWLSLAAAATWPLAYAINALRFALAPESWVLPALTTVVNVACVLPAYLVARWSTGSAPATTDTPEVGSYRLIARIGEGGMGEVWHASHRLLARPAAIKFVKTDSPQQELLARRFQREANAIAGLQSPHSVYLYDFGTTPQDRLYYVMELLDGISLQTLVASFGPQPSSRVITILRQMCRSLEEAHEHGIVHRDLKPSNVMICKLAQAYDFVKVLDFGLAKPFDNPDAFNLTRQGTTTGTPEYMAPEVAQSGVVGPASDIYALGCVGYFLLSGTLVFEGGTPVAIALSHMSNPPVPPSQRTDRPIAPDLERVILACLAKQPRDRPDGARALGQLLTACDVPAWTDRDAAEWWATHLPPTSALRPFARPLSHRRVV